MQQLHENRRRSLEENHANEIKNPPAGFTREQIKSRQEAESAMNQRQQEREQKLLENWHEQENKASISTGQFPAPHFNIPQTRKKQEN